jgi:hypothetical protein
MSTRKSRKSAAKVQTKEFFTGPEASVRKTERSALQSSIITLRGHMCRIKDRITATVITTPPHRISLAPGVQLFYFRSIMEHQRPVHAFVIVGHSDPSLVSELITTGSMENIEVDQSTPHECIFINDESPINFGRAMFRPDPNTTIWVDASLLRRDATTGKVSFNLPFDQQKGGK